VLIISDLHAPFTIKGAADFLSDVKRRFKPSLVVCTGDEVDSYGTSRFAKHPDLPNPSRELALARKTLAPLYGLFPSVFVCHSNHAQRPYKRSQEACLPGAYLRSLRSILDAPRGWKWAQRWEHDGVLYTHGEGMSGPTAHLNAAERFRMSTVIGHLHAFAGVSWSAGIKDRLFGMNVGCLIDQDSQAFAYAAHTARRPTLGCGVICDGVPMFVPYAA
jgi:predicted phosphodiesterase